MRKDIYESPLSSRYASEYMLHLFSPDMRFQTWRRLWVALARAEHELGLPITQEQVDELAAHITDIDYEVAEKREHEVRHDVMAHVYAYGKAAPSAAGIIHLGATSCYVTDNADLVLYRDGLKYLRGQLLSVMVNLAAFAREYAATPTLGYTHYQPAQPVTIGKRATLWMQDFRSDLEELDFVIGSMRFLGCRGTTGTEASFVDLFEGDGDKVDEMNRRIAAEFGFEKCFSVSGQTYPRKADSRILNVLSSIAQSAYRMAHVAVVDVFGAAPYIAYAVPCQRVRLDSDARRLDILDHRRLLRDRGNGFGEVLWHILELFILRRGSDCFDRNPGRNRAATGCTANIQCKI